MAIALTFSRANCGVEAPLISVETHLSNGLPAFTIVGLPEAAVKESRDRVWSAIINSHFTFLARRITPLCVINKKNTNPPGEMQHLP